MKLNRIISVLCSTAIMSSYIVPVNAAESTVNLYSGEISAEPWHCPLTIPVYDNSLFAEGNTVAIQCDTDDAPYLALTSTSGGSEWAQVLPDSAEGNWYYYSYEAMSESFGTDFSLLDFVNVMAADSPITVYSIDILLENPIETPEDIYDKVNHESRVVGYLPDWYYHAYRNLDFSALTHLNIAFCMPDENGELFCNVPDSEIEKIVDIAHKYDVKVMAALGGGGGCDGYMPLIDTPEEMAVFNDEIIDYCKEHNLDGIDFDIELGSSHEIWKYYGDWVASLRPLCDENGYEMSTATAQWVAVNVTPETFSLFDFVNVMAYDNDLDKVSHADMEFAEESLSYFNVQKKIPKDKLVLGVPFYGRGYDANGKLDWNSYVSFAEIIEKDAANYDRDVYNGVAYNGASTMREKCEMGKEHGGIMIWELSQDAAGEYSLLSLIKEELTTPIELPDWIPDTFAEALQFNNTYGKHHVNDGLICCVRKEKNGKDDYLIGTDGSTAEFELVSQKVYNFSDIVEPDKADTEKYNAYLRELELLGVDEDSTYLMSADFRYEVLVYKPLSAGTLSLDWAAGFNVSYPYATMTFDISEDGTITQTDISKWLPDSIKEYNEFHKNNAGVTIQNNHVVYCETSSMNVYVEQYGTGKVDCMVDYSIDFKTVLPTPSIISDSNTIIVFKPVKPGIIKMIFMEAKNFEVDNPSTKIEKYFRIFEDGKITEITQEESGMTLGDCNLDDEISIADAVMLQKWLIGSGELNCWENADMDSDKIIDVFDLVSMRKALTEAR